MIKRLFPLVCASLLCLTSSAAAVDREVAALDFHADSNAVECGDESAFRSRVMLRLGYDPFVNEGPLRVTVRLTTEGSRVTAATTFSRAGKSLGKRVLNEERTRCDVLVDAVAAAVAIAIDPLHSSVSSPPASPIEPSAAPVSPLPAAPIPPPPKTIPTRPTPWEPFVAADFVFALGVAPGATLGAQGGFGVRHGLGSLAVEGRGEVTPSAVSLTPLDRVDSTVFSGAIVPCAHASIVVVCGLARLGAIQTTALDVSRPALKTVLYGAAGLRVGAEIPVGRFLSLRARGEVALPLIRTSYVINGSVAWTPPAVQGGTEIGVAWTFR